MEARQDRTRVVILTRQYRIEGDIAHFPDARLTDYMVEAKKFIAVTDVLVKDHEGRRVLSAAFLNVHRDNIDIIVPASEVRPASE